MNQPAPPGLDQYTITLPRAFGNPRNTIGNVIRTCTGWEIASLKHPGIVCAPVETWAAQWLTNQGTKVA